ncbi:MAG: peptidase, partial [Lachnospiraceae bacterium]|nr:peptidase [Lachnospiraceae bacterium]
AEAILKVQQANADGIRVLKDAGADESVLKLKSLEAFEKVADGKATTILLPAELQGIASLAAGFSEGIKAAEK